MFKTQEQIEEVAKRTGVPADYVTALSIEMSRVKLASEECETIIGSDDPLLGEKILNMRRNLQQALLYYEKIFLRCPLW